MIPAVLHLPIRAAASRHHLAAAQVAAIVHIESGGDRRAWNPEPSYRWLVDVRTGKPFRALTPAERVSGTPPRDFRCLAGDPDQEWGGQRSSWGLMQVMGAAARERGFRGPYLTELLEVEPGLEYGCRQLAWMLGRFPYGSGLDAVSAYNQGSPEMAGAGVYKNQAYVDKYLAALPQYLEVFRAA